MLKKIILSVILICICFPLISQEIRNDIIIIKHDKKSVAKAMLLSSLFPGAGQFYANPKSFTTYVFPIIEVGLWVGFFHYYSKGVNKEEDYENFADKYYDRERQYVAQEDLKINAPNAITYNFYKDHFRLDGIEEDGTTWNNNTQHYYEDIGKWNKYIFGWADWYDIYANPEYGDIEWIWDTTNPEGKNLWIGNDPINTGSSYYNSNYSDPYSHYSRFRADYIVMRKDAENFYDSARYCSFALVVNHILSAIDAVRLTRRHNLEYISNVTKLQIKFSPVLINNEIAPGLFVSKKF
ncbi:MAG: hypothetical protein KAW88_07945 [Candidatus Cloacimonetes bacterium]|nr:hypothetical protein [Candidatus Cloacimonadota bacterium]